MEAPWPPVAQQRSRQVERFDVPFRRGRFAFCQVVHINQVSFKVNQFSTRCCVQPGNDLQGVIELLNGAAST